MSSESGAVSKDQDQSKQSAPRLRTTAGASEQKRGRILETAVRMASREGLRGLTIGMLARAVGMSKSGLFAHFDSKDNLQLMVFQKAADDFTDKVLRESFKEERGEPRFRAIFRNWIGYLKDSTDLPGGNLLISSAIELDDRPGPLRDHVQKVQKQLIENIEKSVRYAIEEGHFRDDLDVRSFAWSLYSLVVGFYHFFKMLEDPKAESYFNKSLEDLIVFARAEN